MPLIDARPDALAMIYARTLLQMVEEKGGREAALDTLAELEDILELARQDPKFGEFISSRVIVAKRRSESLRKILSGRVNDLTVRFILVVNEKGRLGHLPAIIAAYDVATQEKYGRVEVDVFTSEPIDAERSRQIQSGLANALNKEVVIHPYVDGDMIGGIKIRVGDQFIDASVATQLNRLGEKLTGRGQSNLKARIDKIIEG